MYKGIVTRIWTRPHPNADRLLLGDCRGFQVVVGKDTVDGSLGIYFPTDGKLGRVFAEKNNLIRVKHADGTSSGGFFDAHLRIRTQAFRGEKSDGFWCPLECLVRAGVSMSTVQQLREGDLIDTLDGIRICEKYYTEATQAVKAQQHKPPKHMHFPEHVETEQYRYYRDSIPADSLIIITEKLHGTSMRVGNVRVPRQLSWYEKILARFVPVQINAYQIIYGTRRTILSKATAGYYGNEQFRYDACASFVHLLQPDEIVYGEIVGYVDTDRLIMPPQKNASLGKEFLQQYGPSTHYTYGCKPNERQFYVYRITQHGQDLSWFAMCKRAKQLGIPVVPLLGIMLYTTGEALETTVARLVHGRSTLDIRHIREGVVLRIEHTTGITFLKEKSFAFKVLEGMLKERTDYVDREEIA
jgi:hypothetical protein